MLHKVSKVRTSFLTYTLIFSIMFYLKVVRCICIMDHPVPNLPVKDQTSCQIIIPQSAVDRKSGTALNFSCFINIKLLRAPLVTCNPNLQVVTMNFACVACMCPAFIWTSTKNEWNVQNTIWSCMFRPSTPHNLITRVLIIHLVKRTQKHSIGAKVFDCIWTSDHCRLHSVTFGCY